MTTVKEPNVFSWLDGGRIASAIALLYAAGFVVANVHYVRYELVRFDLFRGRYIAAALLMGACVALPASLSGRVIYDRTLRKRSGSQERDRLGEWLGPWPLTVWVLTAFLSIFLTFMLGLSWVGQAWRVGLWSFVAFSCLYGASLGYYAADNRSRAPEEPPLGHIKYKFMYVVWWYCLACSFGRGVYPYLSPAVGGGAATIGRVSLSSALVQSRIVSALSRRVAILDREGEMFDLIVCVDTAPPAARAVSVRAADVQSFTTEGFVAAPDVATTLCGGTPAK